MANYTFYSAADLAQDQIWRHTQEKWGEAKAESYIRGLHQHLQQLADKDLPWRALPQTLAVPSDIKITIYFSRYQHHTLFFRKLSDGIGVLSILHERMDMPVRLREDLQGFERRDR